MNIKRKLMLCLCGCILTLSSSVPAMAMENTSIESQVDIEAAGIISSDPESGITIYRDSAGGTVVSGLTTPRTATEEEQAAQLAMLDKARSEENISTAPLDASTKSNYVDYEYNPIYIGTWSGTKCYARHTLGSYNSNQKRLTSYGYATWYNTRGLNALPYRNGAANNGSGQAVADVVKGSYFDIRDLTTDKATTLQVNDWGPNQNVAPDRIADLDKNKFISLHGNSSDGVFYCRTWVQINNYNP